MTTKYFCDRCKREVETKTDLKTISVSAILTDYACDSQTRTIGGVKVEVCQHCLMDIEYPLRKMVEDPLTTCAQTGNKEVKE